MATLTTAEKATITTLINYMDGEYEKPLDERVAHDLSKLHAKFGYPSQIVYLEALRDKPFSALLQSLLAVAA